MIDPKRLERLWEACPELRPEGMVFNSIGRPCLPAHAAHGCFSTPMAVTDDVAERCVRDAIVWWLARRTHQKYRHSLAIDWFPECMSIRRAAREFDDRTASPLVDDWQTDPTIACILAAERELGLPEWTC